ncbi:MAG: TetR/AcrR family transcriptional regulator, partial [Desulfocapsaceae bacterium]
MKTKKRDTTKKRTAILDAASLAFTQDGYDNASMDRIAELSGSSKRTVYNHFPSKEELFRAVLERFMGEAQALKQISYNPNRSLEAQLGDFADAKLEVSRNPAWLGLLKVTTTVFITNPDLAVETVKQAEDRDDSLVVWLKAATADGKLKVDNTKLAAEAFWAMVGGAFFWPSLFFGPMEPKEASRLKNELVQMFIARYGA